MPGAQRNDPSSGEARSEVGPSDRRTERGGGRRRTYNRRSDQQDPTPPYFEVFERIATALENIEVLLRAGHVTLPDVESRRPANR